ncbi:MAG: hypothetical protein F4207_04605 [Gemmatimonadetes bacterium]|nr:hypothetical protein [Gemmatimonadota bacterium]MYA78523.1 hypothetical protein [Gemmatimonadota bacterium]MYG15695.1 hypothetical protein [Gemmatimonadota bacterium]MYH19853.1 hypothetical protein [Gemmatimonadota bacterium]
MKGFKSGALPLLAAVLLMGCSEADDDGMWRGRTEVVAGASRVISDAPVRHAPDQTADVTLEEDLVIEGGEGRSFASVFGITTDRSGNIYIADSDRKQISKFDESGAFQTAVGSLGVGPLQFRSPVDMALDDEGRLFVLDFELDRVTVFNPDLTFADIWSTQVTKPRRIRIDAEGNVLIFVITQHDLIYKYSPEGDPITKFYNPMETLRRSGTLKEFIAYSDAAMETTEDGYVVVSARHPYWIRKFDRVNGLELEFNRTTSFDMKPMARWTTTRRPPPVGLSGGLAVLPDGRIVNSIQYQEFEQVGLNAIGMPRLQMTKLDRWFDFFRPDGKWEMTAQFDVVGVPMHVDRQGRIYFAELEEDRVVRYHFVFPEEYN